MQSFDLGQFGQGTADLLRAARFCANRYISSDTAIFEGGGELELIAGNYPLLFEPSQPILHRGAR